MALNIIEKNDEHLKIEINNGDLNVLNEIISEWRFKDETSALRFALAALSSVKRDGLYCKEDDGLFSLMVATKSIVKNQE